jgi:hypothetical protein
MAKANHASHQRPVPLILPRPPVEGGSRRTSGAPTPRHTARVRPRLPPAVMPTAAEASVPAHRSGPSASPARARHPRRGAACRALRGGGAVDSEGKSSRITPTPRPAHGAAPACGERLSEDPHILRAAVAGPQSPCHADRSGGICPGTPLASNHRSGPSPGPARARHPRRGTNTRPPSGGLPPATSAPFACPYGPPRHRASAC